MSKQISWKKQMRQLCLAAGRTVSTPTWIGNGAIILRRDAIRVSTENWFEGFTSDIHNIGEDERVKGALEHEAIHGAPVEIGPESIQVFAYITHDPDYPKGYQRPVCAIVVAGERAVYFDEAFKRFADSHRFSIGVTARTIEDAEHGNFYHDCLYFLKKGEVAGVFMPLRRQTVEPYLVKVEEAS